MDCRSAEQHQAAVPTSSTGGDKSTAGPWPEGGPWGCGFQFGPTEGFNGGGARTAPAIRGYSCPEHLRGVVWAGAGASEPLCLQVQPCGGSAVGALTRVSETSGFAVPPWGPSLGYPTSHFPALPSGVGALEGLSEPSCLVAPPWGPWRGCPNCHSGTAQGGGGGCPRRAVGAIRSHGSTARGRHLEGV